MSLTIIDNYKKAKLKWWKHIWTKVQENQNYKGS